MTERDEELLYRVASGDVAPDSPAWTEALAREPALAPRLRELEELGATLDRQAREERDVIAHARSATTERDRLVVRAMAPAARVLPVRATRRRLAAWVAAAAVAGLLGAAYWMRRPERAFEFLGVAYRAIVPNESLGDARRFEWKGDLPPGGRFVVRIYAVGAHDSAGTLACESKQCTDNFWVPSDEELQRIPPTFVWRVVVEQNGAFGNQSELQRAQRSRS